MVRFLFSIGLLRGASVILALMQTLLWTEFVGVSGLGYVSAIISACLIGNQLSRLGVDNLIVREYHEGHSYYIWFLKISLTSTMLSFILALIGVQFFNLADVNIGLIEAISIGSLGSFMCVNQLLGFLLIAESKQKASVFANSLIPTSGAICWVTIAWLQSSDITTKTIIVGLVVGYGCGVVFAASLCAWPKWIESKKLQSPPHKSILTNVDQRTALMSTKFLNSFRDEGIQVCILMFFGSNASGLFALSKRFANLLAYVNEPARLYLLPRVSNSTDISTVKDYERLMTLSFFATALLVPLITLAFFYYDAILAKNDVSITYVVVLLAGYAINVLLGPVGVVLAMKGREQLNLLGSICGFIATTIIGLYAIFTNNFFAMVCGHAAGMAITNTVNFILLQNILIRNNTYIGKSFGRWFLMRKSLAQEITNPRSKKYDD